MGISSGSRGKDLIQESLKGICGCRLSIGDPVCFTVRLGLLNRTFAAHAGSVHHSPSHSQGRLKVSVVDPRKVSCKEGCLSQYLLIKTSNTNWRSSMTAVIVHLTLGI